MKYAIILAFWAGTASADAPLIEGAKFANGRFDVTLSHPDTGWDHYADGWRVEDASGAVLGLRVLGHPHVTEQPFTRSLKTGGPLPAVVYIRSRCIVDGWSTGRFELVTR